MPATLAFDVYGTLIDTHGVVTLLREMIGDRAQAFSQSWRDKQLEYSFRRGLMQNYANFAVCTRDALDYCCTLYGAELTDDDKQALLDRYKGLPAFDDVGDALSGLGEHGHRLFAFSNGTAEAVAGLLNTAGIRDRFQDIVSVDDLRSFKPNPAVYAHFLRQTNARADEAWLISSNPFDVIGAVSAGMRSAWVKRSEAAVFDPWGIEPTVTISSLAELRSKL
ncbi:MAG: haloacid dehalogenase type II [Gammaproteobacteria bacterium]